MVGEDRHRRLGVDLAVGQSDAALAEAVGQALRLLARQSSPADGAAVLLHELFEVGHAELARASGRSEAGSRQQLRRALGRLRQGRSAPVRRPHAGQEPDEETVFRLYLQALQCRDPQGLWALLRQPPVTASAPRTFDGAAERASPSRATVCSISQVGGKLALVLTLDGLTLCVLPLGVRAEREPEVSLL